MVENGPESSESYRTLTLPPPNSDRVYVLDLNFPHPTATKVSVVDGRDAQFLGTLTTGYLPDVVCSPFREEVYVVDTFYSRGSRGERTDVVTVYDARTLQVQGEVIIPGRFLVVGKQSAALGWGGRYLFSYDMSPSQSVNVVDLKTRTHLVEVDTPGGGAVKSTGSRQFSLLTSEGGLMNVSFDPDGSTEINRIEPFFDPFEDPVMEQSALHPDRRIRYHISYEGQLYPFHIEQERVRLGRPWSALTERDRQQNWRPGGTGLMDVHASSDRLFVLFHRGGRWTQKQMGTEVWVFDCSNRRRVNRIPLNQPANTILVSQGENPRLYTLPAFGMMDVYEVESGSHLHRMNNLGVNPLLLFGGGARLPEGDGV